MTEATAVRASTYLTSRDIQAQYIVKAEPAAGLILDSAREQDCGLKLMEGYSHRPLLEIAMGSVVDELLRSRNRPVFICR